MACQLLPLSLSLSSPPLLLRRNCNATFCFSFSFRPTLRLRLRLRHRPLFNFVAANEDATVTDEGPSPQDLQYINQIKTVLQLLRKNRDMLFGEVKLTVMIEDPREVERRRLLGIEDPDAPTRDDLVAVLDQVNEGKVPTDKAALKMLAQELNSWPNLEVEAPKTKPTKSLYAKATDTGINPKEAAKRLNIDWDSAAEIEDTTTASDNTEVPPAVGYGALYLVTAFPVIIGISVVLILFFNSLQ